jgi:hypothetical protein
MTRTTIDLDIPHDPAERARRLVCKHSAAKEVHDSQQDGYPGGDIVTLRCPDCGKEWEAELPQ